MNIFGFEVNRARHEKRLTLDVLGKKCRTGKGYLSGMINDKVAPPSPAIVRRICKALDLNPERMLALSWLAKMPDAVSLKSVRAAADELLDRKESEILEANAAARKDQERAAV